MENKDTYWGIIMKIAFFTDSYKPYLSGVVKSIDTFREELENQGHRVYIFAPDYPGTEKEEGVFRFRSLPTPVQNDFRLAIPLSHKITEQLRELEIDIIHTHSPFLMGWLARYAARRLSLPLVFTYHTLYDEYVHYLPVIKNLAKAFTIRYCREYCQSADLVIAPSVFVEKRLRGYRVKTPIVTVPTGIDLETYLRKDMEQLSSLRRELAEKADFERLLIFVGRLGEEKNVYFLLRAINKLLKDSGDELALLVVGDGPERISMEDYCSQVGISSKVIFVGKQSPEMVTAYYQLSDLFVFPSVTETQGLVTLEAMASGLPVVAVDAAGTRYMVDDGVNGILVEEDENAFAGAVLEILKDDESFQKMSESALTRAMSLSSEKTASRLVEGYQSLFNNQGVCNC
jgi:1,2-diacylglycerol 3-alpha-glucosyltransferase